MDLNRIKMDKIGLYIKLQQVKLVDISPIISTTAIKKKLNH